MLEDARAGKFDLIVTREVCRFARNTVDTLVHTRELKNIGVEVYFVEDNIWTMDGDGELRLSLMATLAQEESRKVSERVRAGQKVSREKGTLYGSGNILGYERVGSTYVINPDQAETVRMIFEMYLNEGIGTGKIANRLTEMGRLNASGLNKWSHGVVSRVLNNQTYMGVMAYGKSYNNNYLDQKRINNHDKSSYICVEGDFPPIVTPEEWHRTQEIKAGRIKENFSAKKGKKTTHCTQENRDLWGSRLRCTCGCGFRKNVWHKYDDKPNTYGYQCYNILNNGSANQRRKAGADDTGYCDQPMIADWKLELQAEYDSKTHNPVIEMDQPEWGKIQTALEENLDLSQPTPSPDLIRKFVAQIVPEGKTNFQWHLNLDGNQTTHVGMTVEGRKNKAVVSFATEGTCSPLAFGAVIEYPTLCRAATDKNAYLSAMQDRLPSRMAGTK